MTDGDSMEIGDLDMSMIPDVQAEITLEEDEIEADLAAVELAVLPEREEEPSSGRRAKSKRGSQDLAEDLGVIVRSSGRNSRKKIDPDFHYDNSLAFVGATRRRASAHKSPASSGGTSASSTSAKRVSSETVETSKISAADTASSASTIDDPYIFNTEHHSSPSVVTPSPLPSSATKKAPAKTRARKSKNAPEGESDGDETASASEGEEGSGSSMDSTKLYCICRKPYDNRFMISCDNCEEWYHGHCVGVTKSQGKQMEKQKKPWWCPTCRVLEISPNGKAAPVPQTSGTTETSDEVDAEVADPSSAAKSKPVQKKTPKKSPEPIARPPRPSLKMKPKKQSEPKPRPEKVEELPAEVNNKSLELMALGVPQQTGTRALVRNSKPSEVKAPSVRHKSTTSQDSPRTGVAASVFFGKPLTSAATPPPKSETKPTVPKPKMEKGVCHVCREMTRENSMYCSSTCILRHGTEILSIMETTPGAPEHVTVLEKHTGRYLKGADAPTRSTLLAWLEGHQTFYVPIKAEFREAFQAKTAGQPEEDPVRTSTRIMLKDHLMHRYKQAADLHEDYTAESVAKVAEEMEMGLFQRFGEANIPYKKKYRVIVLNIDDKKNDNFFRRLIRREVELDKVADLSQDDMASDKLVKWRQQEIKKDLDMIIQTQPEELTPQVADFKTLERGDEVLLSEDMVAEQAVFTEDGANLHHPMNEDTPTKNAVFFKADDYFPSSPSDSKSDVEYSPTKAIPADTAADHEEHIFDANCSICNDSLSPTKSASPNDLAGDSPRDSMGFAKVKPESTMYFSPTVSTFRQPVGVSPVIRNIKADTSPVTDSPGSSVSDYSPREDQPGVIWRGEVNTVDLPIVKLQAFGVYGKATEFMKELPAKLRQLGRLQPQQMWPYLDEVKTLKDLAVVAFRSAGDRVSNEFNSLHYFLTTRGRVSVLGPLPKGFKDLYMIALKENEPLPQSLKDIIDCDLDAVHPKIFLGIIVHHRPHVHAPAPPPRSLHGTKTVSTKPESPYESPKSPDSEEESLYVPTGSVPVSQPRNDPIVNRFLGMVAPAGKTQKSPDTSEPMEIDDEDKASASGNSSSVKKISFSIAPTDSSKTAEKSPSKAAVPVTSSAATKTPLVDPRLARLQAAKPPLATVAPAEKSASPKSEPNSDPTSEPKSDPEFTTWPNKSSEPSSSGSDELKHETKASPMDDSDGFGFSQKFIANLHKINLPPGLKEALQSIAPPAKVPENNLAPSVPTMYQTPPPGFGTPGFMNPRMLMGIRPALDRPPPFVNYPPPNRMDYRGPEAGSQFGDRTHSGPSRGGPPPGASWQARPDRPDYRTFDRNMPPNDDRPPFRRDSQEDRRFQDRPPARGRWSNERERDRNQSPQSRERPSWNRNERRNSRDRDRNSQRKRSRSRSRSPVRRRRFSRNSEDRVDSRKKESSEKEPLGGVDEFGRDVSLRKRGSEDRSSTSRRSDDSKDRDRVIERKHRERASESISPDTEPITPPATEPVPVVAATTESHVADE